MLPVIVAVLLCIKVESSMSDPEAGRVLATMSVFLVRGLCTSLQYPYAQFVCKNLKAEQMYRPVTEAIFRLERLGLKVCGGCFTP